jgi:hypothetical protein
MFLRYPFQPHVGNETDETQDIVALVEELMFYVPWDKDHCAFLYGAALPSHRDRAGAGQDKDLVFPPVAVVRTAMPRLYVKNAHGEVGSAISLADDPADGHAFCLLSYLCFNLSIIADFHVSSLVLLVVIS